jgi:hypothetical protein
LRFVGRFAAGGAITVVETQEVDGPHTWIVIGRKDRRKQVRSDASEVGIMDAGHLVPQSGLSEASPLLDGDSLVPATVRDPFLICADEAAEEINIRSRDLRIAYRPVYRPVLHVAPARTWDQLQALADETFQERLRWGVEPHHHVPPGVTSPPPREHPNALTSWRTVDAELMELGKDVLTVCWRWTVTRRTGKLVVDPRYGAIDLMCAWRLRFDLPVSELLFLDGESQAQGVLLNRSVFIFEPDQFHRLFQGKERVENVRRHRFRGSGQPIVTWESIPPHAALNPPLAIAGRTLLWHLNERYRDLPSGRVLLNNRSRDANADWLEDFSRPVDG